MSDVLIFMFLHSSVRLSRPFQKLCKSHLIRARQFYDICYAQNLFVQTCKMNCGHEFSTSQINGCCCKCESAQTKNSIHQSLAYPHSHTCDRWQMKCSKIPWKAHKKVIIVYHITFVHHEIMSSGARGRTCKRKILHSQNAFKCCQNNSDALGRVVGITLAKSRANKFGT